MNPSTVFINMKIIISEVGISTMIYAMIVDIDSLTDRCEEDLRI